ncbi:MAG: serine protein kinase [Deltaproteobacteria bacterium]|nr:serine protein kinase [Deltaproteobacteria bacterium]MCX7953271.1 serine protein kinase [Deltaproteobacteria bacterium]
MGKGSTNILDLIEQDREKRKKFEWRGTVLDYIELVKKDPSIVQTAHERIFNMIIKHGIEEPDYETNPKLKRIFGGQKVKIYKFFASEFFGMEKTIQQLVRYFQSASLKGEESRQVLFLVGPVGSGKSSLVEKIKRGLEELPPFYALEDDPMFGEPLTIVPRHFRPQLEEILGVKIEGDINPVVRYRLLNEFKGKWESYPVATYSFSIRARRGIGVVPPVDPNNQDTSVLIGSEDISKLDKFSEGDPRVLDLSGALNRGNRGLVEFIEIFKNEVEYLHTIITATQEKSIPAPGRHGMIYVDTCIIAHSNESEWKKFRSDPTNEAILDRLVILKVPYNLRLDEEVKIYKKILRNSNFKADIAPHTLDIAAMFAILSRLEPTPKCDLLTKLRLYNGEEVLEKGKTKKIDVQELMSEAKNEGMTGISTRFIMKAIDNALSDNLELNCIHPLSVKEALINMVREGDFPEETKKQYLEFLQDTIHKEYLRLLEQDITKAFVYSFEEQAEALFQNYLDHAEAFVTRRKVKDRHTGEDLDPDENFMRSIEETIGITGSACENFRQEVIAYLWSAIRKNEKLNYKSYEPLRQGIENKLMFSVRELVRVTTKSTTRDEEQRKRYNKVTEELIKMGYPPASIDTLLRFAANNLWKD